MRFVGLVVSITTAMSVVTAASAQSANRISATISGLRSDQGVVRCGLYASADGFRQPGRELRGAAASIRGQRATCVFGNVPVGTYAIAAFHAEQNEAQIETGAFGKPKQGYGFSRNASGSFGPPGFSDAAFEYRGGAQALQIRLQY
jgi:uncharacterized protein (DUF2141 family)